MKKKRIFIAAIVLLGLIFVALGTWIGFRIAYPRPQRNVVEESGLPPSLVYAVIRAESSGREDAESAAGALGLMQLMPSTAEYICERENIAFDASRLTEGAYNVLLGTKYMQYLMERFPCKTTMLAAYNAGEGTVERWLGDAEYSSDGVRLEKIPYAETAEYVKKVIKFEKIYEILY